MPLRYLFVDMNSYFASVEQEDRPELRGRPVAVVPTRAETTCCIAASYEAKRRGVKTGTLVREARRLCPDLCVVEARPHLYVTVHRRIVAAVESCLPVASVVSIDEMACRLTGTQQQPEDAVLLAGRVKEVLARDVGRHLRCSVGLGPNVLLAKVASDLQKPDGLTVIDPRDLPERLYPLQLTDFPGIGPRMERRLRRHGVGTVRQLCEAPQHRLAAVWGSRLLAERWWLRLRGEEVHEPPTRRRSVSHSHVLPPQSRNDADARAMTVALLHKAAARLRSLAHRAGSLTVLVTFLNAPAWQARRHFEPCRDTLTLLEVLAPLWDRKPAGAPLQVGVILGHLTDDRNVPPSLFAEDRRRDALADAMDRVNDRLGRHSVYFGGMHREGASHSDRIAFTNIPDI